MIPKIIHYVWLGEEMPLKIKEIMASWIPSLWKAGYTLKAWDNTNVQQFINTVNTRYMFDNKLWSWLSNYIRCVVLYKYGGFYIDTDVIIHKSFDIVTHLDTYIGLERCITYNYNTLQDNHTMCSAIIGSKPNNNLFKNIIDKINTLNEKDLYGKDRVLFSQLLTLYIKDNIKYKVVNYIKEAELYEKQGILPIFNAPKFDSYPSVSEKYGDIQDYGICDHVYMNSWVDHEVKQIC